MNIRFSLLTIYISLLILGLTSCSDYFEQDSKSVINAEEHLYDTELEARNGMFGLLQELQNIGDNYVLMGELRADLMSITTNSTQELRDISENNISGDNSYLKEREWYALVNNCNYYINHLDTAATVLKDGEADQMLRPYMAQAKTIRAWAYLNICLDYGKVRYSNKPILTTSVDNTSTQTLELEQLLPILIDDVKQAQNWLPEHSNIFTDIAGLTDPGFTSSITYEGFAATQLMFPLRFVLGELYMWQGDFLSAVKCYYELILWNNLKQVPYVNAYSADGTTVTTKNWSKQFTGFNYSDILTAIVFGNKSEELQSQLYSMANKNYTIAPSAALITEFNEQDYFTGSRKISGDLRGLYGTYTTKTNDLTSVEDTYISKYSSMQYSSRYYVSPCRAALIWLRYAECLNRLGKPRLAFYGFLKYGLSARQIKAYISAGYWGEELTKDFWINFGQDESEDGKYYQRFASNTKGFHARGCGDTENNRTFVMPEMQTLNDTIEWVEDKLMTEYALETALEGNRFHDLMRIATYRNDPAYLAEKVSRKNGTLDATLYSKLLDTQNWYLPKEK